MEAPVGWVGILGGAVRAHGESRHGGVGAVVGHSAHDGQARPAVGAVGEGMVPAAAGRVVHLGEAGGAGRRVRRHLGGSMAALAGGDGEVVGGLARRQRHHVDGVDPGQRRAVRTQPGRQRVECVGRAPGGDEHAVGVVAHGAGEVEVAGQPPHHRPEADALHHAAYPQQPALGCGRCGVEAEFGCSHGGQCTVHTMQGSKERTTCCIAALLAASALTGVPTRACSSAPGVPAASRGEKFQVVGAMIW
ncbi:hypothetical protein GALL_486950 [mine drainage metagenome]|uniref:Uncharacterized protein n=1 Tax=mine drainage metagenome TaxID=410659 RepID=A0A1J5PPK2_9ZZZZ